MSKRGYFILVLYSCAGFFLFRHFKNDYLVFIVTLIVSLPLGCWFMDVEENRRIDAERKKK